MRRSVAGSVIGTLVQSASKIRVWVLNPPRLVVLVIPSDVSRSGRQAQAIKRKPWVPRLRYIHLDGYGACYVLGTGFHPFSAVVIVVEADPCRLSSLQFETPADAYRAELIDASDGVVRQ